MIGRVFAVLAVLGLASWGGWEANGWRLGKQHAEYRDGMTRQLLDQQNRYIEQARQTNELLAELDRLHTRKLNDAQAENERLRADIRDGERRLSVRATCPAVPTDPEPAGVDDGASRADIDPAAAERIVRIVNDGDDAIRQLTALQEYVERVCLGRKEL